MARLSVNLNKVALLRNSRHTGVPDLLTFAEIVLAAGAAGITVHPRPDERHIRRADVPALAELMRSRRPTIELNIEGYPDARFHDIVSDVRPEQCTLVPDSPSAFTSEKGWDLNSGEMNIVKSSIDLLKKLGSRIILFVDPDPAIWVLEKVKEIAADGIEIYTGSYAADFRRGNHERLLHACTQTACEARSRGLVVNVGHDLNLSNLPPLVERIPFLAEASIGHELTADALRVGFDAAVKAYLAALAGHRVERGAQ
jgi:pyridoxine 5-phosphate synthase